MKKTNTILIICLIALIGLPIAYYYGIARPSLEREKFEYQKRIDQEERDRKAQEELEKKRAEEIRKDGYADCIANADLVYDLDLKDVCQASYNFCVESVDSYNALGLTYAPKRDYSECEKYKMKDGGCVVYSQLNEGREKKHKESLENCERLYN